MVLPVSIVGPIELGRVLRELEAIQEDAESAVLRQQSFSAPHLSRMLDELFMGNQMNVNDASSRESLLEFLREIKKSAPVVHMSFNEDPSVGFIQKIVSWFRTKTHPLTLIRVGLQPNIGVGCMLRTKNKYYDFSLRQHFKTRRDLLFKRLLKAISESKAA